MTGHRLFALCYDRATRAFERKVLAQRRARLLSELSGTVLDLGAGTGANLPHLRTASRVLAVEPDPHMRRRLATRSGHVPVRALAGTAEALPLADGSADVAVCTLVLCTVPDPPRALAELHRVLTPGGWLVALEHVRGTGRLARWQDLVTPVWRRLAAGCRPNRDTESAIRRAGFTVERREAFTPLPPWMPVRTMLELTAVRT